MNDLSRSSNAHNDDERLYSLALRYLDGIATVEEEETLIAEIQSDSASRWTFVTLCRQMGMLHEAFSAEYADTEAEATNSLPTFTVPTADVFPSVYPTPDSLPSSRMPVGTILFSYAVSALFLCVALLGAWAYKISLHENNHYVEQSPPTGQSYPKYVGRISGMKDCVWADKDTSTILGAYVPFNRKYALSSGLLEITYTSGARVILEGPCEYTVDSDAGGYLAAGKLTARVDKRGEKRGEREVASGQWPVAGNKGRGLAVSATSAKPQAANPQSPIPNPQSLNPPLSTLRSPLFTITTPTAVVTDLGTEFGVEVDEMGKTISHVFQGRIDVRAIGDEKDNQPIRLDAGESIEVGHAAKPLVKNNGGSPRSATFVRHIPRRVRIETSNTGETIDEASRDLRWQLVARTDGDPNLKLEPVAVISCSPQIALPNNPGKSQWIACADNPTVPEGVTYTFRTTFQLKGMSPETAVLRGRFLADDHVSAIRINGHNLKVAPHRWGHPFVSWCWFQASDGFIVGTNILEIDVFNDDIDRPQLEASIMSLRVEYEVTCFEALKSASGRTGGKSTSGESSPKKNNHPNNSLTRDHQDG